MKSSKRKVSGIKLGPVIRGLQKIRKQRKIVPPATFRSLISKFTVAA